MEEAPMPGAPDDSAMPSAARRRRWVVATTMVGTVSTILAATIVNVAFPALIREFNIGHDSLQWVATGFLAATTTSMLATAWLVETFGQRRTFVATMTLFFAASLLGAASWNTESLIAARVLQGATAGVMQPLSMIALFEVFPLEQRGRAMGLFGFGVVLAPAIGPAAGALLMEVFGWRAIFLLSVPFCAAALVACAYGLGLFGTTYLVLVFVQDIAGYSPARAGNLLVVPGLALAVAIALAGRLTDRAPPRFVVSGGLVCFALSSLLLAFTTGTSGFWLLALWLTIGRAGLGLIIPALNVGAVQTLPAEYLGHASAAVNFARQLGGAVGVNLLAVVLEWRLGFHDESGGATMAFRDCFLVVTIAFAAAVVPALSIRKHARV